MALSSGTRLGPYEVLASLGAGGMGEVYRARDTKLGRDVALKVLPDLFVADPDRLARFEREAQVLASLNHPHIAAIYGLEEGPASDFAPGASSDREAGARVRALVLELVEGETLAERIARGPIALDEALPIAREICGALEAAHELGITHRDLKPANIKITPKGVVKVLDFGLAKLAESAGSRQQAAGGGQRAAGGAPLSMSPTITSPAAMTGVGVLLGTAAYMAPEQAKGRPADKRSDIWAFGCVLYEMLTGKRPFEGEDISDTLANVLKLDPALGALPPSTPPPLRRLLRRALAKDPGQRLHDIADARLELEEALHEPAPGPSLVAAPAPRRRRALLAATIGATALFAAGLTWWLVRPEPEPVRRLAITFSPDAPLGTANDPTVAISPDGSNLVYVSRAVQGQPGQAQSFMLRRLGQLDAVPLAGTESGHSPFFSPDGQWVGFFADSDGTLRKASLAGGPAVTICKAPSPHLGATWMADGTIVFGGPVLSRVSSAGGTPDVLTKLDVARNETRHAFPDALPNGKGVLFTTTVDNASRIELLRFDTGARQVVVEGGSAARYVPTGHVVFSQASRLFAVPFDQGALRVTGAAVPVLDGVAATSDGPGVFSFSRDGSLVYLPGGAIERRLVWVDLKGREEPLSAPPRAYSWVRISPDGTRLAMQVDDPANTDVWVHDLVRKTQTRLTFAPGADQYPIWTRDGRRILYVSGTELLLKSADGTGEVEQLATGLSAPVPGAWSPDGRALLLNAGQAPRFQDIYLLPVDRETKPQPLIHTQFAEVRPVISPNGRWIAFSSIESGRLEIYVQPFPEVSRGRWQISTDGGDIPIWSPTGRELYYRRGNALMRVPVEAGQAFSAGTPTPLFEEGAYLFLAPQKAYDLAPEGQRFLMLKEGNARGNPDDSVIVVQNWFQELKRLVPSKN